MEIPRLPARYKVSSPLGAGGSGRVYRVLDAVRGRLLALKLVARAESEWLRNEFDTLRETRHENVIQVFDFGGAESGQAFYTMGLVEGQDWGTQGRS